MHSARDPPAMLRLGNAGLWGRCARLAAPALPCAAPSPEPSVSVRSGVPAADFLRAQNPAVLRALFLHREQRVKAPDVPPIRAEL